ncbi:MAG: glucosaminidase domain-containing protein [Daejeonella sp.]
MKSVLIMLFVCLSLSVSAQNSVFEYIEKYKDVAIRHMNEQGVPASVILGISIHESACGNSKIARYLNNHFGMKGKNSSKEIKSSYRGYESVSDSYQDFMGATRRSKKFEALFSKYSSYDYYNWVLGIQNGGYASSKLWGSKVLAIIKQYKLHEFDKMPQSHAETTVTLTEPAAITAKKPEVAIYRVKKGDTLSEIAEKFGTDVKKLMSRNSLNSSRLSIGQKLML